MVLCGGMNVLFLSAEVAPFVSVGGLSQVMYFLPQALKDLENDVRIFTANYGTMDKTVPTKDGWKLQLDIKDMKVPIANTGKEDPSLQCNVLSFSNGKHKPLVYFLQNNEY